MDKDFLLRTYGQCYGEEGGRFNLSLANKYLEYMFAKFFEENFAFEQCQRACNIGIGAGYWDRYLSYLLPKGSLTSIEIDPISCRQLEEGLINEQNPNNVRVICFDVMDVQGLECTFDIVTMVGSTRLESGLYAPIINKALDLVQPGGALYYQTLAENEQREETEHIVLERGDTQIASYLFDHRYGFTAQYWKITRGI